MDDQKNTAEFAQFEQINGELRESLGRCRALLKECRSKLAANANDVPLFPWGKQRPQHGQMPGRGNS